MKLKIKFILALTLLGAVSFSATVLAEGKIICTGEISNQVTHDNANAGTSDFDEDTETDLSVLGIPDGGFAPADSKNAACTDDGDATFALGADEYMVRGYAWNTNLSFISFYCDGVSGPGINEGVACGAYDYYTWLDTADSAGPGSRQLKGYAWNSSFGYINFYCKGGVDANGDPCGAFDYGVTRDEATGDLSGYAFSQAGIYMNFDGINMQLPGVVPPAVNYCDNQPYVCIEVEPDASDLDFVTEVDRKYADAVDGYKIIMHLKEVDGVTPLNTANYDMEAFFDSLRFTWEDTVKQDQRAGQIADTNLGRNPTPLARGGGIVYKPVSGLTEADFEDLGGGEYKLKKTIRSIAPTSNFNKSMTSSLEPAVAFKNETFLHDYGFGEIEPSVLELKNIAYTMETSGGVEVSSGPIYPNGKDGISFKFAPPIAINTLYANDEEDKILGFRGIPISFKIAAEVIKKVTKNPYVNLYLDYDQTETSNACGTKVSRFDFFFLSDPFLEEGAPDETAANRVSALEKKDLTKILDNPTDMQGLALIDELEEGEIPCDVAQGPGFYTVINYLTEIAEGAYNVYYYSNKLPRIGGDLIYNPAAIVHGNVYTQIGFTPTASISSQQQLGSVNIDIVRDTIKENMAKEVRDYEFREGAVCNVKNLNNYNVSVCSPSTGKRFVELNIGDEYVYYTRGNGVEISSAQSLKGPRVIIVDGGNLYLNADIYNETRESLAIVVLRRHGQTYAEGGNIYIGPKVKNIQANIVADGSLFSYSGDKADIDKNTGEPVWASSTEMVDTLKNQLFIEGSISSRNTVGGADLDSPRSGQFGDAKDYLLLGTGEILEAPFTPEERLRAQLYDLNYLRLFKQAIQMLGGLPVDQQCQKALTSDDLLDISNGVTVIGENNQPCDGINPLAGVDQGGDLVPPEDTSILAEGLDSTDYGPVYIYYVAPPQDSFVFSSPGTVQITD
ncbi:hypothetical protein GF354_04365 [Candidatus Peregrinibacteria bacterium]|nr:hypothetical protein [Candidatus Peregrinibacteria bacterium]